MRKCLVRGELPKGCDICMAFLTRPRSGFNMAECQLAMQKAVMQRQIKMEAASHQAGIKTEPANKLEPAIKAEPPNGNPGNAAPSTSSSSSLLPQQPTATTKLTLTELMADQEDGDFEFLKPGWYTKTKYYKVSLKCNLCSVTLDLETVGIEGASKFHRHIATESSHLSKITKRRRLR